MCYAYAPPGALFDASAAAFTENYVTSMVVGMDVVPRLSVRNVLQLRQQILRAIKYCKEPKYSVLTVRVRLLLAADTSRAAGRQPAVQPRAVVDHCQSGAGAARGRRRAQPAGTPVRVLLGVKGSRGAQENVPRRPHHSLC